jgi:beta-lactam-binding protein with PASTA domain/predicted Ser/Thr protein kinase
MRVLAGRYELLEQVGHGGMSVVWRARDLKLERDVAIKLLRSFLAEDTEQRRRFQREARTLAALAHEHIVRVYDYASSDEQSFLVMEYVAGGNLAATTRGSLPLSAADAAAYGQPVAEALAYAHAHGVVHRDLTPSNILIERSSGRVVTTDYGLARIARSAGSLTAPGVLLGTPEYWSPEQALGRDTGEAADIYALGCMLFLLVAGRLPFEGEDRLAVGLRRAHEEAPSLREFSDEPEHLVTLVDSLLARDPAQRPGAAMVAEELTDIAVGATLPSGVAASDDTELQTLLVPPERETVVIAPPEPAEPVSRRSRYARRRVLAALSACVVVIVAALVLAGEIGNPRSNMPNVVDLREDAARAQLQRSLPTATVTVQRMYSMQVAAGRVIRQQPEARTPFTFGGRVQLVVSRGTPFASVPPLAGRPAATARSLLARQGFRSRYVYEASWTVRKGRVIGLRPRAGSRLRRPAGVTVLVASGYPRSVVPDVGNASLASAQGELASSQLRYRVVYQLTDAAEPGRVISQIPAAGRTVYQGTQVRLTVARTLQWVKLFDVSGADVYESDPFTVTERWRIRYRLTANDFGVAFARFSWSNVDSWSGGHGFAANFAGSLRTYVSSDGAGTYRLAVQPYAGTRWYVEVDVLR